MVRMRNLPRSNGTWMDHAIGSITLMMDRCAHTPRKQEAEALSVLPDLALSSRKAVRDTRTEDAPYFGTLLGAFGWPNRDFGRLWWTVEEGRATMPKHGDNPGRRGFFPASEGWQSGRLHRS